MAQKEYKVVNGIRVKDTDATVNVNLRVPMWLRDWLKRRAIGATLTDSALGLLIECHERETRRNLGDKIKTGALRK